MLRYINLKQILPELAARAHTAPHPLLRPAVRGFTLGLPNAIEDQKVEWIAKGSDQRQELRRALWWTLL